ncbi:MAG: hypothetical protein ACI82H_001502 [Alphaproteobacteria bacterium]|jgi:uncharacterized protein (TIGR01244 family)
MGYRIASYIFAFAIFTVLMPAALGAAEAPFGDKVSAAITYYNRAAPGIATAGLIQGNGVVEAKGLGFKVLVDLRGPAEGLEAERAAAKRVGLTYVNIPVTTRIPTDDQVRTFARVIDNAANHPVLVHCQSANRAGAMWALYRASKGVPGEIAIEEGRATGLTSREPAVRVKLGLAPVKKTP